MNLTNLIASPFPRAQVDHTGTTEGVHIVALTESAVDLGLNWLYGPTSPALCLLVDLFLDCKT